MTTQLHGRINRGKKRKQPMPRHPESMWVWGGIATELAIPKKPIVHKRQECQWRYFNDDAGAKKNSKKELTRKDSNALQRRCLLVASSKEDGRDDVEFDGNVEQILMEEQLLMEDREDTIRDDNEIPPSSSMHQSKESCRNKQSLLNDEEPSSEQRTMDSYQSRAFKWATGLGATVGKRPTKKRNTNQAPDTYPALLQRVPDLSRSKKALNKIARRRMTKNEGTTMAGVDTISKVSWKNQLKNANSPLLKTVANLGRYKAKKNMYETKRRDVKEDITSSLTQMMAKLGRSKSHKDLEEATMRSARSDTTQSLRQMMASMSRSKSIKSYGKATRDTQLEDSESEDIDTNRVEETNMETRIADTNITSGFITTYPVDVSDTQSYGDDDTTWDSKSWDSSDSAIIEHFDGDTAIIRDDEIERPPQKSSGGWYCGGGLSVQPSSSTSDISDDPGLSRRNSTKCLLLW